MTWNKRKTRWGTQRARPALQSSGSTGPVMSEKAGEIARESSDFRCERCHKVTRFARGALIPACPHCGYGTYDISNPRFETKDGHLGPHEPG
jgi:hypothetical protein